MESGAARSSRSLIVSLSLTFSVFVNSAWQFLFFPLWIAPLKYFNLLFFLLFIFASLFGSFFVFFLLCFYMDILALEVFDLFLFHFLPHHQTNTTSCAGTLKSIYINLFVASSFFSSQTYRFKKKS